MEETVVAYPEELSIFDKPIQDLGVKQARCITYYPVNDFSSHGVIQFRIPNNSGDYIDLRKTRLNVTCKIVRKDGKILHDSIEGKEATACNISSVLSTTPTSAGKSSSTSSSDSSGGTSSGDSSGGTSSSTTSGDGKSSSGTAQNDQASASKVNQDFVTIVNNIMHSLFSRVDIALQDKILTNSDDCYPYEAYIKTLLMTTAEEKEGLQSQGFFQEKDCEISSSDTLGATPGKSVYLRRKLFKKSREVDFSGPICSSVMEINKLIPNGVPLSITLHRSTNKFCLYTPLMGSGPDIYDVIITKATLSVCTVSIAPEIAIAHSEILSNRPAILPFNKTEVKKFTLAKGIYSSMINDPFQGAVPEQMIIGIVKDSAQNGEYMANPYFFEHSNLNFLSVTVDGQPLGIDPLQVKYGKKPEEGNYLQGYQTLSGINGNGNPIKRLDYPHGFTLYRFHEEYERNLKRKGNVTISLRFDKALEQGMCLIVYATFPGGIKVDKSRAVYDL